MRTILAPGIEIKEIDKSNYSPAMTGTGCFIPMFSSKGEPYRPMEFTSRSAFENYYGTPDNEAERYGYAAACEVLNQGGRLWCARLPYDNAAFEKLVGVKYSLRKEKASKDLSVVYEKDDNKNDKIDPQTGDKVVDKEKSGKWHKVQIADDQLVDAFKIIGGRTPVLYDLSAIDEYRTDEAKVPADTFLIVDTTGASYSKVKEDSRKGQKREVIGIIPVVTTAANAMYAQSLIQLNLDEISDYEPLKHDSAKALEAYDAEGNVLSIDGNEMCTGGLLETDLVNRFNTNSYFSFYDTVPGTKLNILSTLSVLQNTTGKDNKQELENALSSDELEGYTIHGFDGGWQLSGNRKIRDGWRWQFKTVDGFDIDGLTSFTDEDKKNFNTMLSVLNSKKDFIYETWTDFDGVGKEIAFDALETPCIKNIFQGNVQPYAEEVFKVDENGELVVEQFTQMFVSKEEAEAKKAELSEDSAYDTSSFKIVELETVFVNEDDPQYWAIVSAEMVPTTVKLDESDPRYGVHGIDFDDSVPETMSLNAATFFSTIQPESDGGFEAEHMKDIGVVVYKCYLDPAEGNKVTYEPVEAYCGSLCKDDKDPNTGVTKFIDTIINTNSQYINFFSNCFTSPTSKKFYKDECDILLVEPAQAAVLGLYTPMTKEDISINKSIYDGLNKAFEKVEDINKLQLDIVCDAGVSNIASYLKAIFGNKGPYDLSITDDLGNSMLGMWKCMKYNDPAVKTWKTVVQKLDNFCKNVRKDCMFITECPRPLVLQGQKKIIRDTKPGNTIDEKILPYISAICGLNTNYGAGYTCWFEAADDYSGDFFWCPPSIKAMGVYINTDVNYEYWDAPAGLNRGIIAATDVAFSPTSRQAGSIYEKCWNYAINYPNDGIVLEGQKTFQTKPSALDRVNVRRLLLRLERSVYQTSRWFLYEGNTQYTRQRLVDAVDPYFKDAKNRGGLYDYIIKCDESNNTPEVIDRNELKLQIGVKPVKTAEFILVDIFVLRTGGSWSEMV